MDIRYLERAEAEAGCRECGLSCGHTSLAHISLCQAFAFINSWANTPNIWCSYLYTGEPYYYPAFGVNLAAGVVVLGLTTITWLYLKRCNARLDKGEAVYGVTEHQRERGFRFML